MEENHDIPKDQEAESQEIPKGQIWFDKIFLLLALSIAISGLVYNAWGLWELFR
ncbi:hypothetical protein [Candidatus Leptofilum sp.]|uniref:hypothetical protein n=1 Tax=Candidatus Leptofilum sp. TaxID=3241576 RepID=UPI003B5A92CF